MSKDYEDMTDEERAQYWGLIAKAHAQDAFREVQRVIFERVRDAYREGYAQGKKDAKLQSGSAD